VTNTTFGVTINQKMTTLNDLQISKKTKDMTQSLVFTGFIKDIILANQTCQILLNEFDSINTETAYILNNLMSELKLNNISFKLNTAEKESQQILA